MKMIALKSPKARINFLPNESDLREVNKWLYEEHQKCNQGFYCNWLTIERAHKENNVITLHLEELIIGFLVWRKGEIYIEIDIFEVHTDYRNKGIGRYFFDKVVEAFKQQGTLVIKLTCAPRESENFWIKMGLLKFSECPSSKSDLTYYRPLVEVKELSKVSNGQNKLELWDLEPHMVRNSQPLWAWSFEDHFTIKQPIINPCSSDWNIRLTRNGIIVKESKVKRFSTLDNPIDFNPFLYIKNLSV